MDYYLTVCAHNSNHSNQQVQQINETNQTIKKIQMMWRWQCLKTKKQGKDENTNLYKNC